MTYSPTAFHSIDAETLERLARDGPEQARRQERQARWMGLVVFVAVLAGALWAQ